MARRRRSRRSSYRHVNTNVGEVISSAIKDIEKYDGETQRKIKGAVKQTLEDVAQNAKRRIHSVTGTLSEAISTSFNENSVSGYVNAKAPHAHLVEFGVNPVIVEPRRKKALKINDVYASQVFIPERKPRPFFKPAAEQERPKLEQRIKEIVKK